MSEVLVPGRAVDPQQRAADPGLSAFVTANAGSGKTKTLIDRVARLLLAGAAPESILCVTYTKAAASEMQRRLFGALGGWSVENDADLLGALSRLEGQPFDPARLSEARSLFAQALETPGGLKIQTIHAFCEKLLRRFPLEAGVPPGFQVMDDAAQAAASGAARRLVATHALTHEDAVARAYSHLSVALDFQRFEAMFREFEAQRGALAAFFDDKGGLDGALGWVWRAVNITRETEPSDLAEEAMSALVRGLWRNVAAVLAQGGKRDQKNAAAMLAVANDQAAAFDQASACLFTAKGEPADWVTSSSVLKAHPGLHTQLMAEQTRLADAHRRMRRAAVGWDSAWALTLAYAYLEAYRTEKRAAGALDFADLIEKTCHLLRDTPAAAWVLYKLDGGIDHILVDEAQDTAPDQWRIIKALTEEFFSGTGVGGQVRRRDLFVVGDPKQSIYSFQGAQPELLLREYEFHRDRASGAGFEFERVELRESWRSTPEILGFVDAVFAPETLSAAIQSGGLDPVRHTPMRTDHLGCVDVWPLEVQAAKTKGDAWTAPLDLEPEDSANRRLARRIAEEICALIARGDAVFDKTQRAWRPAHAGDVLILVRRRGVLFDEILRALKTSGLPVAGADRLALNAHIVFDDVAALARFVLFPADELNLAALLKSPFCGLDDDSLYALAHGRGEEALWTRLQRRAAETPAWEAACTVLRAALELAPATRPFEFYARILGWRDAEGRSMRQRLLGRLGGEAEDVLDELLNQILAAESRGAHTLERLAADFATLTITVKREMDGDRQEVRVMTAHGAKGLEAPIVFLPETTMARGQTGSPLMRAGGARDEGFLWCGSAARDCEASAAARTARTERDDAEAYRLLYVALTRARDRLVLCGRRAERTNEDKIEGWWGAIRRALEHEGLDGAVRTPTQGDLTFQRFGQDPRALGAGPPTEAGGTPLPGWSSQSAPADPFARIASPSRLDEAAAAIAPSPLSQRGGLGRFRRGDLIHRLLQLLPDLPPQERAAGARALLAREPDLTEAQRAEMAEAALAVLADARFAEVFGPGSRAEVAIAGGASTLPEGLRISGRLDRLVVLPDRVLAADFKTNRPSPDHIEAADPAYLRQMALYAAVLAEIFPGRAIEAALIWTDGPKLMPIPENLLARSLSELGRNG